MAGPDLDHRKESIRDLMALPKADYIADARDTFYAKDALSVGMHEGAIVAPNSKYTSAGTNSLLTCIGVAVHSPATKATGLCHLVSDGIEACLSEDSENSLIQVLNGVKAGMDTELEARMLGAIGGDMNDGLINQILDIASPYNVTVLSAELKGKDAPKGFAVDCERWDEGLIRGGADMVDFMNDPYTGGFEEMIRQKKQSVDLGEMTVPDFDQDKMLIYDATCEPRQRAPSCD